jgi:hypothetical protein
MGGVFYVYMAKTVTVKMAKCDKLQPMNLSIGMVGDLLDVGM